jgi:hypothetical protein
MYEQSAVDRVVHQILYKMFLPVSVFRGEKNRPKKFERTNSVAKLAILKGNLHENHNYDQAADDLWSLSTMYESFEMIDVFCNSSKVND